jgi:cytoskeletal protein CcmA (bactofilin family)
MANTYTPTYNLLKPEVGADTNAWGTHINSDLDTIDANMVSRVLTSAQTFAGAINLPADGLNVGSGQLRVNGGNVSMSGQMTTTGAATFSSTITVASTATLQGALNVTGATALSSTLAVTGATTLAANGLNVGSGQLNVTGGNVAMSGNLNVTGNISGPVTASTLAASGATTLSGTLSVTGASTLTGNLTIQSSTSERQIYLGPSGGYFFGNASAAGWFKVGGGSVSWDTAAGNLTASGNLAAFSDARLKTNVQTIHDAVALVSRMRGVFYERTDTGEPGVGVIAQEMQEVIPAVVIDNGNTLSVAYANLVGVLIEAVKEVDARLSALEAGK